MQFEDLKRVWREESSGEYKRVRIEDLSVVHGRASKHLHRLTRLELFMVALLAITIILLGQGAFNAHTPLLAWPGAVLLWGFQARGLALMRKLRKAKPDPGLAVRDAIHVELKRLRLLERFRSRTVQYMILTFLVGEALFLGGVIVDPQEHLWLTLPVTVLVLVSAALGVRGNRQDLRVLRPLREELQSWTVDLERLEADSEGSTAV